MPIIWVYERATDELTKEQLLNILDAKAKAAKVKNFDKMYQAFVKQQEHKAQAVGGLTEFEGQPLQLAFNKFGSDGETIWTKSKDGNITVINHPIMPIRYLENIDTGECRTEVWFSINGNARTIVVSDEVLSNTQKIIGLSKYGIAVNSNNAKYLVSYFEDMKAMNLPIVPFGKTVNHMGWTRNGEFAPYCDDLAFDGSDHFTSIYNAIKETHGDRQKWFDCVEEVRKNASTAVRIFLDAAFAAAMLDKIDCLPFIVHMYGETGQGKTVALKLAASIFANPNENGRYIFNFNSTSVGIEQTMGFLHSLPAMIDELQMAQNKKDFDTLIYLLAEGNGRTRGARDGGIRDTASWKTVTLTTGEVSITKTNSNGGAINRVIQLSYGSEKLFDNAGRVAEIVSNNYGFAGREFVELLKDPEVIEEIQETRKQAMANFCAKGATEKQAMAAAILIAASELVAEEIFHDDRALKESDLMPYLVTKQELDTNARCFELVRSQYAINARHFDGSENVDVWGELDEKTGCTKIIKKVLDGWLIESGYDPDAFLRYGYEHGFVKGFAEKGRNKPRTARPQRLKGIEKQVQCVSIDFSKDVSGCTIVDEEDGCVPDASPVCPTSGHSKTLVQ